MDGVPFERNRPAEPSAHCSFLRLLHSPSPLQYSVSQKSVWDAFRGDGCAPEPHSPTSTCAALPTPPDGCSRYHYTKATPSYQRELAVSSDATAGGGSTPVRRRMASTNCSLRDRENIFGNEIRRVHLIEQGRRVAIASKRGGHILR